MRMRATGLFLLFAIAALFAPAMAQAQRIAVQVTAVAGPNAYLDAGAEHGIATGDTLVAYRDDRRLGALRVVNASASRSVVTFLGESFSLTRGDRLVIAVSTPPPPVAETPATDTTAVPLPQRRSIFDEPSTPLPDTPSHDPVRLTGRLQVGTTVLQSTTRPLDGGASTNRTFALPFAGIRGRVTGLPGDVRLNLNGRVTYRYRSEGAFDEPLDPRLYQASVEKSVGLVRVEAGRFYNEYDRYSGYLDGLSVHVGSAEGGVGVTAGVQPDRADAGFSTDLPKYTAFAHYRLSPKPVRIELMAVAGQVVPQNEALQTRTFFGLTHRTYGDGFALSTDLLVDEDPATGETTVSRLLARGSAEIAEGLRLRARFQQRRPYILFDDLQQLRDLSERIGGGISYRFPSALLGGTTIRADVSSASAGDLPASLTVSGSVFVPRTVGGIGLNANASVWTRDDRESIYASAALTRSFGGTYGSLGYRYQQTPLLTESLVTHGVEGTLQLPLWDGVSATMQGSAQFGETLTTLRLYTGLGWRL